MQTICFHIYNAIKIKAAKYFNLHMYIFVYVICIYYTNGNLSKSMQLPSHIKL